MLPTSLKYQIENILIHKIRYNSSKLEADVKF